MSKHSHRTARTANLMRGSAGTPITSALAQSSWRRNPVHCLGHGLSSRPPLAKRSRHPRRQPQPAAGPKRNIAMQFVGFDPGGNEPFGRTVLESASQSLQFVGTRTGVTAVLTEMLKVLEGPPAGIGIDAPLFWVQQGDRAADHFVRALVIAAGGYGGTVMAVNSLVGACLVQGVLIAIQAHDLWPEAQITEAHRTALSRENSAAHAFVGGMPACGAGRARSACSPCCLLRTCICEQGRSVE